MIFYSPKDFKLPKIILYLCIFFTFPESKYAFNFQLKNNVSILPIRIHKMFINLNTILCCEPIHYLQKEAHLGRLLCSLDQKSFLLFLFPCFFILSSTSLVRFILFLYCFLDIHFLSCLLSLFSQGTLN